MQILLFNIIWFFYQLLHQPQPHPHQLENQPQNDEPLLNHPLELYEDDEEYDETEDVAELEIMLFIIDIERKSSLYHEEFMFISCIIGSIFLINSVSNQNTTA